MGKLVVLKIIDGSFDQGFTTMLQIGHEGERPFIETLGKLPPLPEMPLYYSRWQDSYWRLESRYRISAKQGQKANVSLTEDCVATAQILRARFNAWLLAEEFRPVREKWLERLSPDEEIRIILQTEDSQLRQLPWPLLDFLERYPKAEFALSALTTDAPPPVRSQDKAHVNILAVIGNSEGIDTQADQALLASLPHAKVATLVEPDRKQLNDELWRQPWDILFFAGHSSSHGNRESGKIFLNKTDSLSISELKYALRKSMENGLQLAIFNSCDGLGLARELADLRIPQIIVMREPVPDRVAQEFLKNFLSAYAKGTSLYIAVREARERLQGLEHQYPCATWLPLICQHPAVLPPTWEDFTAPELPQPDPPFRPFSLKRTLTISLLTSLIVTSLVSGLRAWGMLQPLELAAFDQMTRLRPEEVPDARLFVVTIDDEDIRWQREQEDLNGMSISNRNLSRLLSLINRYQPAAIGLDVYRDSKTPNAYPHLMTQLQENPNLIAICKVGYEKANPYGIAAPPEIPVQSFRVGFSDFVMDGDEVVRRHLLATTTRPESKCQVETAFTVELALRYLQPYIDPNQTGFAREWQEDLKISIAQPPRTLPMVPHGYRHLAKGPTLDNWHPYEVLFPQLRSRLGVYQGPNTDTNGTQILLNYRATSQPDQVADSKPLRWFLSEDNPPTAAQLQRLIQGRIVLIGITAREQDDYFKTPYGKGLDGRVPGVFLHAHMLSQLLSTVLDGRPLLWLWSPWLEGVWVGGWAIAGGLMSWVWCARRSPRTYVVPQIALTVGVGVGMLYTISAGVLIWVGGWLPFIPAMLVLGLTSTGVTMLLTRQPVQPLKLTYSPTGTPIKKSS
ncbi:MAG: CHASE2 domain-containing protein [Leptolyngbyaceae cyanobacterium bins.349]|nr:CHASE2 domain-containing protein [Leptolyngbyaceae cyanobacterium bins.349]